MFEVLKQNPTHFVRHQHLRVEGMVTVMLMLQAATQAGDGLYIQNVVHEGSK